MPTAQEVFDDLEQAIINTNRSNDDQILVFKNDENTPVTLRDGTVVDSLDARVKRIGGTVKSVVGKTGVVTTEDISEALGLSSSSLYDVPMLWFFNPYYEKSGETLYFKPSVFPGSVVQHCFYIRNSSIPDFSMSIDEFYNQLSWLGEDKFKVTSPLGVPDCIRFDATDCLYFDHRGNTFTFGARSGLSPVSKGKTLMIHNNYAEIGNCVERPNIMTSLVKHQFDMESGNDNTSRYVSVASAKHNIYASGASARLTTDANGLVIYDTVARYLYIPEQTTLYTNDGILSLPATNVDIGSHIDSSGSTLIRVFWDKIGQSFVTSPDTITLTDVEKRKYILFCSVRHVTNDYPDLVSLQGTMTYKIDCGLQGQETSKDRATIMTGGKFHTQQENYFSYSSTSHALTIPEDTVLRYGIYYYVVEKAVILDLTQIETSAIRVFWDVVDNVFVAKGWGDRLTTSQRHRYVLLCGVRDRSNFWGGETKDRIILDLTVPYLLDGKLYGITEGGGSSEGEVVHNRLDDTVKAIAHRGYSVEAPENTLPAYILAKKRGYSYAEADINFTKDEVPVLLHDSSIDRTSNGVGNISELTFDEVRQYDYGSWKGDAYIGTQIPSYLEFLQLCHKLAIHPYIEMKTAVTITPERAEALSALVRRAGLKGKVTYISFSYEALSLIKQADPYARLGFLADANVANIDLTNALKTGTNEVFLDCWYGGANREIMNYALDKEVPVEIWTVNDPSVIVGYADIGVSGVTTDVLNIRQILNEASGIH